MKQHKKTTKDGKLLPYSVCPQCKRDLRKTGHDGFCPEVTGEKS